MLRRSWMSLCAAVTLESVGQHGHLVTLAKEKSLNALNVPMVLALKDYYADFHKAPANSLVVVLQGAGTSDSGRILARHTQRGQVEGRDGGLSHARDVAWRVERGFVRDLWSLCVT
jgi:enoyl-CoA hydratase/carnithine racemase